MTTSAAELFAQARVALTDAPRELLGSLVHPRRILGIRRSPRIVPAGTAWHLGVFLVTDDAVLATGEVVRARHEAIRGYTAQSQRQRSELAAAASRGGFADGTAVHIGWTVVEVGHLDESVPAGASDVLRLVDGRPTVRWSTRGGRMPLESYLRERVELLLNPPTGAT